MSNARSKIYSDLVEKGYDNITPDFVDIFYFHACQLRYAEPCILKHKREVIAKAKTTIPDEFYDYLITLGNTV